DLFPFAALNLVDHFVWHRTSPQPQQSGYLYRIAVVISALASCSAAEHAVERGDDRGGAADQHDTQHHFLEVAANALRPLREHRRQRVGDEPEDDADDRDRDDDREQLRLKRGDGSRNTTHWDTS